MSTVVQQSFEPRLHWPTAERNGRTSKYGNRDDTISEPVQLNGGRLCLGFCLPTNAVKAGRNGLVELKRFKNRLSPPLYLSIHGGRFYLLFCPCCRVLHFVLLATVVGL